MRKRLQYQEQVQQPHEEEEEKEKNNPKEFKPNLAEIVNHNRF